MTDVRDAVYRCETKSFDLILMEVGREDMFHADVRAIKHMHIVANGD